MFSFPGPRHVAENDLEPIEGYALETTPFRNNIENKCVVANKISEETTWKGKVPKDG